MSKVLYWSVHLKVARRGEVSIKIFKYQADYSKAEPRCITRREWPYTRNVEVKNVFVRQYPANKSRNGLNNTSYPYEGYVERVIYYVETCTVVRKEEINADWLVTDEDDEFPMEPEGVKATHVKMQRMIQAAVKGCQETTMDRCL